ncbi:Ethanolamine ammonia-lyase light chain [Chitinophaga costaii]|uniref:Ethanolamine ammonia-lyase small subunit n=2 Tax=Chitinophaga costaii TaxID=1335309 RepID=A0A1C4FNH8_9BACT|nr:ethanolamine ammonia-lyase subunit EutC [Chitinophaga costaii]SCC57442.1 Ethanolamine ammonia-lyase light chain [Chitinophaga costaii]
MEDAWKYLQQFTTARIALGRTGTSIPLSEMLAFRMAHAHARDAVYSLLDVDGLQSVCSTVFRLPVRLLWSQAAHRDEYLQRPDKGRQLHPEAAALLEALPAADLHKDIAFVITDGLSATAVNVHALPLLSLAIPRLQALGFSLAPIHLVTQGRVAVGDPVGAFLQTRIVVVLIGERPGLSSPDSMGAYLTFAPAPGLTDVSRNCISNIRPAGLSYAAAADRLVYLLQQALRQGISGVHLKDDSIQETRLLE